jgi:type I restriction enzyme S subunit
MVLAGFVVRVRLNEKALPEFVSAFMNTSFSKQMLLGMCKAAIGQANINAQELQNIGIYIPPIELQKVFVSYKAQVDKSKVTIQQGLNKLEHMKQALMQKYFG